MNVSTKPTILIAFYSKTAAFCGFQKTQDFSAEKPILLSKIKILNVLRNLTNWVAYSNKIAALAVFKKLKIFFEESISFVPNKSQFSKVLRNLTNSVAFLLPLAIFQKNHNFFSKNTFISFIKANFRTFWEVLLFQLRPPKKSLTLAISTKSFFLSKNPYNLIKITRFWTFRKVLFFQSRFTASLLVSAIFWKKSIFFGKPTIFGHQKT